ncbi:MAG TPA: VWA domain-containing protein [Pyrinomonadaceae bacterium]|nr:VWA domain-containing protein [Pyrinomonadaceae bacterium]
MAQSVRIQSTRATRAAAFAAALILLASAFWLAGASAQQPAQDGRPRRAGTQQQPAAAQTPAPTATPARASTPTASPQAQPSPSPSPGGDQGQEIDPDEVLTVDTNLVNLNVRVIDRNNRPINDVPQSEFRVFEDGVQQKIEFFTREQVPITYGLVVDNSRSISSQLQQVQDAAKTIINSNKPGDEAFVVRFVDSDKIEEYQDFTSNEELLHDAVDRMYAEGGQTAVIDAVLLTAEKLARYKKNDPLNDRRRRALVLVTDGEDRSSVYKQEDLFDRLREEDVQIYVIGFTNELSTESGFIRKSPKEKAVKLISRLATETGGRAFFPNSVSELPQIAEEITKDLRTQYVIGYYPTNSARDGSFRQIRVQIADAGKRDKRIAITRPGRTASPAGRPPQQPASRTSATKRP